MARIVREIMNRELFTLAPEDTVNTAMLGILATGITAAPVLDAQRRPLGVVSLRDLIGELGGATVGDRMTTPAVVVAGDATLDQAARLLSDANVHRLVVVDDEGLVCGVMSSMDLVRGLAGLPVVHPIAFMHADARGLAWSDPKELNIERTKDVPVAPGLIVLIHGGAARPEIPVWAESTPNLQERLDGLAATADPTRETPQLRHLLQHERKNLRFRAAPVYDDLERVDALLAAQRGLRNSTRPDA